MRLGDIATVKTGLVLSRKAADENDISVYEYKQLNLKSINEDGTINLNELDIFRSNEELNENYLTKSGDIIVRLTVPNTAVLISEEQQGLVVPSHFCLIRIDSEKLLPEYLQWYLNSEIVKKQIAKSIMGSVFAAVRSSFFSELQIKVPEISKQKKLVDIYLLAKREIILLEALKNEKGQFYKKILRDLYKKLN